MKCGTSIKFPHKISNRKSYSPMNDSAYLDWYYCDPQAEEYPIRDVTTLGKFEPHYEDGTFNVCRSCNQRYLNRALKDGVSYIFFFTRYRGIILEYKKKYYITGFFKIGETCKVHQHTRSTRKAAIASIIKFYKISDAFELSKIVKEEIVNARHVSKRLNEGNAKKILKHFSKKKDQTKQYISYTKFLQN